MKLLEIKDLSVLYKTGYKTNVALKNVNLSVFGGEYICIVGNNGTGKSSLIKCMLGLQKSDTGSISLFCNKNDISYVPQLNTIPLDFPATVEEIILTGTQKANFKLPFYSKCDKASSEKAIKSVGLERLSKRKINELSGGQRQRVFLARALCKNPKLLILDEPCSGLDEKTTNDFYELLGELNSKFNKTVIMITHDYNCVKNYATRVIKLENKVVFDGSVGSFFKENTKGELL